MAQGPVAYENWRASKAGLAELLAYEYPLFSDAQIVGDLPSGYGPYQLFNTIPAGGSLQLRPVLMLRAQIHLNSDRPQMDKTDSERYHAGGLADEITALVSLCFGIRLKAGVQNRVFGLISDDPRGRPLYLGNTPNPVLPDVSHRPILPRLLGRHRLEYNRILGTFPSLAPTTAIALIRAARLYQEAVWLAESAPESSWLLLTSAIETAANHWRSAKESPAERLIAARPKLVDLLKSHGGEALVQQVAEEIADSLGATKKFVDFILAFLPDPPEDRPAEFVQHSWNAPSIKKTMSRIYSYRSKALHGGNPFPAPMCQSPTGFTDVPAEIPPGQAASRQGGTWVAKDTPMMLHTFEFIVRHALLKWWQHISVEN